jgi:hypothetical protein
VEFNGLLILAALWFLLSLLGKKKPKGERPRVPGTGPRPQRPPLPHSPGTLDATQQEGSRLELVLREFERALEQAGAVDRPARLPLPSAEEVEERQSLEVDPEVVSLETEVRREPRRRVDQDDDAEQIETRRISAAAARDKASTKADHAKFDSRIRQEVADKTATSGYSNRQLRDAVVWREILGPPVSLREEASDKP